MPRIKFQVTANIPDDCRASELRQYIFDALSFWGGQSEPPSEANGFTGDVLFGGLGKVSVKLPVIRPDCKLLKEREEAWEQSESGANYREVMRHAPKKKKRSG